MGANENTEEAPEGAPRKEKEADASVHTTGTEGQTATLESPNVSHEKSRDVVKGTPRVLSNAKEASEHMLAYMRCAIQEWRAQGQSVPARYNHGINPYEAEA